MASRRTAVVSMPNGARDGGGDWLPSGMPTYLGGESVCLPAAERAGRQWVNQPMQTFALEGRKDYGGMNHVFFLQRARGYFRIVLRPKSTIRRLSVQFVLIIVLYGEVYKEDALEVSKGWTTHELSL